MNDTMFIQIVKESETMAEASKRVNMNYYSFREKAKELGCFSPNPGGKGTAKPKKVGKEKFELSDILEGKHPQYQSYKLKIRLIQEGIFEDKCSICGWDKKPNGNELSPCELDHINGDPSDNSIENLRILCPNCHSLTKTYRFRRGKTSGI